MNKILVIFLTGLIVTALSSHSSFAQTLHKTNVHISAAELQAGYDECAFDILGNMGLIKTGVYCTAYLPLPVPEGGIITSISPLWVDASTGCNVSILGMVNDTTSTGPSFGLDLLTYVRTSATNYSSPTMPSYGIDYGNTYVKSIAGYQLDAGQFPAAKISLGGNAYSPGSNNNCGIMGVGVEYYE